MMLKNIEIQSIIVQVRFIKTVLVILAMLLMISVLQLFSTGIQPVKKEQEKVAEPTMRPQVFTATPLFGKSPRGVLQQTRLNLTLKGTFASDRPKEGSAIIGSPDAEDKVYVVGDKLPGDAVLLEVEADYVVLEYQGNREILRLPEGQRLISR